MTRALPVLAAALALGFAAEASAHGHLTSADPRAGATIAAPRQITLRFSEALNPKFSGFTVTMPKMGGMKLSVKVSVAKDRLGLVGVPAAPLSPGVYKVAWHVVTADTHRTEGAFSFTVR